MKLKNLSATTITSGTDPMDLLSLLAKNREIDDLSSFLKPKTPCLDLNLVPVVNLIKSHLQKQSHILIYGDYDVDGITATAILWQSLSTHSSHVLPFIPHREQDGYGFKADSFFRFEQKSGITFDLLITVDNGIVAHSELKKLLKRRKIDIVVVDHHLPTDQKLPVNHLIHSTKVSGAALSWFLASKFSKTADLGLAALGTVADCLPLTGVNRSLVVHGLQELQLNPSPGIKKLISVSNLRSTELRSYDLGFILGPRINAVGRLSDPTDALRLLCSQNQLQASKYAQKLNDYNLTRQDLQKESIDIAKKDLDLSHKLIFVLGDYNPGIIGLIASRLTEEYFLPSIVISTQSEVAKGSCRSINHFNIIQALRQFSNLFVDLGGHSGAAGFSIDTKNISHLQSKLTSYVDQKLKKYIPEAVIEVDAQMDPSAISLKNVAVIQKLEPFGIGNPEPVFVFKDLEVTAKRLLGASGDHLKLTLNNYINAIAFKKGDLHDSISVGDHINLVARLSSNTWNGVTTPQLIIIEFVQV